jgi:DNA-binding transcriptional LysR family regulator
MLMAAVINGRGVASLPASYDSRLLDPSQKKREEGLLRVRKWLLPEWIWGIVVAHRRFGCTELVRTSQELGFPYVTRIQPEVSAWCREFCGNV